MFAAATARLHCLPVFPSGLTWCRTDPARRETRPVPASSEQFVPALKGSHLSALGPARLCCPTSNTGCLACIVLLNKLPWAEQAAESRPASLFKYCQLGFFIIVSPGRYNLIAPGLKKPFRKFRLNFQKIFC